MAKDIIVVVLDDEEYILTSLKRLFINETFEIATATDSKVAEEIISREKIKVVMSDQRMPDISGVEFLKKIKEKYPDIIRILFTGHADLQAAEEAINIGEVYRFINKPWSGEELKAAVRQAIRHHDLVIENRKLFEEMKSKNIELDELNQKLKNMYEAQREFSSTVSHELRTPLASIKTAIDIVMSGTAGDLSGDQKNFLEKAKANVDRLNRLINDILDLSKLESGRATLRIVENDMNKVIAEIVELQRSVAKKRQLYLKTKLDPNLSKAPFDVDKIIQIIDNLVSNAIKFTEKGGITISTVGHKEDNFIEVCVEDTGVGIKNEDIPKLFQKFQQLGDPAKRQTGGTGLGLAICKEIVRQHNGKIWMESQFGEGTKFYFNLPIVERRSG